MKIEEFEIKLKKFNETYELNGNRFIIKTDTPLYIYVTFKKDSYLIDGKIMKLNFITGLLKMTLKSAYSYATFLTILMILLLLFSEIYFMWKEVLIEFNTAFLFLAIIICVLFWTGITYLRLEILYNTKRNKIIDWLDVTHNLT